VQLITTGNVYAFNTPVIHVTKWVVMIRSGVKSLYN